MDLSQRISQGPPDGLRGERASSHSTSPALESFTQRGFTLQCLIDGIPLSIAQMSQAGCLPAHRKLPCLRDDKHTSSFSPVPVSALLSYLFYLPCLEKTGVDLQACQLSRLLPNQKMMVSPSCKQLNYFLERVLGALLPHIWELGSSFSFHEGV